MAAGYLLSPFFALGIFLHSLQDSFTTVKDRGCEWFYPLSRRVKRGNLDLTENHNCQLSLEQSTFIKKTQKELLSTQTQTYKNLIISLLHGDESMDQRSTAAC